MKEIIFSIVTPAHNSEKYIEETIESVLSQEGDFVIEYIIVDGNSTDRTMKIVQGYRERIESGTLPVRCRGISLDWISEKDDGMYEAINKGFARASGNIYAYINSDDIYLPAAFDVITKTFLNYPNIDWLKGVTSSIDEHSEVIKKGKCFLYNREWIRMGIYGTYAYFVHQEGVFWRSSLWPKVGAIDESLKRAGDYYLWTKLAEHASLWSLKADVSCFRRRPSQLSADESLYREEQQRVKSPRGGLAQRVRMFSWISMKTPKALRFLTLPLYAILFPGRNRDYVDLDARREPVLRKAYSYVA